jgi:hypothetical protein
MAMSIFALTGSAGLEGRSSEIPVNLDDVKSDSRCCLTEYAHPPPSSSPPELRARHHVLHLRDISYSTTLLLYCIASKRRGSISVSRRVNILSCRARRYASESYVFTYWLDRTLLFPELPCLKLAHAPMSPRT